MKIKTEIFIDKYIIKFFIFLIYYPVKFLGKVLKIDHNLNKDFNNFAIVKYKGMGSILQSIPLITNIKKYYPKARVTYISSVQNAVILEKISVIDDLILLNDRSFKNIVIDIIPFIFKLIKRRFQILIDLEVYSNFSSLMTTFSFATNRFGFYLKLNKYRLGIYNYLMYYNISTPIHQTYLQLLRIITEDKELSLNFYPLVTKINIVNNIELNKEKYILINPNASELRIERRWGKRNFISLINNLINSFSEYKIILIGSANESKYVNSIYKEINDNNKVIDLSAKTNIDELIALIKYSTLFITNDSGPMHIASSLNVKTLSLFGPCSPSQYGSQSLNNYPIYLNLYCSPCVHEFDMPPCKGNNHCMQNIKVAEVYDLTINIIQNNAARNHNYKDNDILYNCDNTVFGKLE